MDGEIEKEGGRGECTCIGERERGRGGRTARRHTSRATNQPFRTNYE